MTRAVQIKNRDRLKSTVSLDYRPRTAFGVRLPDELIPRSGSLSLAPSGLSSWHASGVGIRSPKGCSDISQGVERSDTPGKLSTRNRTSQRCEANLDSSGL